MLTLFSLILWAFTLLVLTRLLLVGTRTPALPKRGRRVLALLTLLAVPLLFRPHELLLSGQDPGVYLNTAGAIAHHRHLFYVDALLADAPRDTRPVFLFGHWGYGVTKDSCLEVKDLATARIGPRFPPFYPILMSPLMRAGPPFLGLCVVPLFAIFTGLALCVLAERLLRRPWAGVLAFVFYLGAPMVLWHARAPRPEVIASFFALAGFGLCLHAWEGPPWRRWPDLLLGLLCVTIAPFFHVTGWFIAVGAAVVMLAWIATGRADGLLHPPLALLGLAGYIWQTLHVADQYQLRRFLVPWVNQTPLMLAVAGAALAAPIGLWYFLGSRRIRPGAAGQTAAAPLSGAGRPWCQLATAGLLVALVACAYFSTPPPALRRFSGDAYHYIHLTDLRLVPVYFSGPIAAAALAGVLVLVLARRPGIAERLAFLAWMLPGALAVGNMQDFFMTRYLLTALCPLLACSLAAVATLIPPSSLPRRGATVAVALLIGFGLLHHRRALITTTEYRGLGRFLESFATPIRTERGILLAEYSRLASPLEHLFGIPLLSLDNETRDDYRPALRAWAAIMDKRPNQPAFLLTPFPPPIAERFTFTPVASNTLRVVRLSADRYRLPDGVRATDITLFLYRVAHRPPPAPPLPYVCWPDAGNLGVVRFTKTQSARWALAGVPLPAGVPQIVRLESTPTAPRGTLFLFAHTDSEDPRAPALRLATLSPSDLRDDGWTDLGSGWGVLRVATRSQAWPSGLSLMAPRGAVLTDAWCASGGALQRLRLPDASNIKAGTRGPSRWARSPAQVLLPAAADAVVALLVAPAGSEGAVTTVALQPEHAERQQVPAREGVWQWALFAPPPAHGSGFSWARLITGGTDRLPDSPYTPDGPLLRVACVAELAGRPKESP